MENKSKKISVLLGVMTGIVLILICSSIFSSESMTVIATGELNIYEKPYITHRGTEKNKVLEKIFAGEKLVAEKVSYEKDNLAYRIKTSSGVKGWVHYGDKFEVTGFDGADEFRDVSIKLLATGDLNIYENKISSDKNKVLEKIKSGKLISVKSVGFNKDYFSYRVVTSSGEQGWVHFGDSYQIIEPDGGTNYKDFEEKFGAKAIN